MDDIRELIAQSFANTGLAVPQTERIGMTITVSRNDAGDAEKLLIENKAIQFHKEEVCAKAAFDLSNIYEVDGELIIPCVQIDNIPSCEDPELLLLSIPNETDAIDISKAHVAFWGSSIPTLPEGVDQPVNRSEYKISWFNLMRSSLNLGNSFWDFVQEDDTAQTLRDRKNRKNKGQKDTLTKMDCSFGHDVPFHVWLADSFVSDYQSVVRQYDWNENPALFLPNVLASGDEKLEESLTEVYDRASETRRMIETSVQNYLRSGCAQAHLFSAM